MCDALNELFSEELREADFAGSTRGGIMMCKKLGLSYNETLSQIKEEYQLTEEQAREIMDKNWKQNNDIPDVEGVENITALSVESGLLQFYIIDSRRILVLQNLTVCYQNGNKGNADRYFSFEFYHYMIRMKERYTVWH